MVPLAPRGYAYAWVADISDGTRGRLGLDATISFPGRPGPSTSECRIFLKYV